MSESGTNVSPSLPGQPTLPSGHDPTGQGVAELKRCDRPAPLELVTAVGDAVDFAAEYLAQPPRVPVMVTVAEHDVLRRGALIAEPVGPRGRHHRINEYALGREVIRVDVHPDVGMADGPMPEARGDLIHGRQATPTGVG